MTSQLVSESTGRKYYQPCPHCSYIPNLEGSFYCAQCKMDLPKHSVVRENENNNDPLPPRHICEDPIYKLWAEDQAAYKALYGRERGFCKSCYWFNDADACKSCYWFNDADAFYCEQCFADFPRPAGHPWPENTYYNCGSFSKPEWKLASEIPHQIFCETCHWMSDEGSWYCYNCLADFPRPLGTANGCQCHACISNAVSRSDGMPENATCFWHTPIIPMLEKAEAAVTKAIDDFQVKKAKASYETSKQQFACNNCGSTSNVEAYYSLQGNYCTACAKSLLEKNILPKEESFWETALGIAQVLAEVFIKDLSKSIWNNKGAISKRLAGILIGAASVIVPVYYFAIKPAEEKAAATREAEQWFLVNNKNEVKVVYVANDGKSAIVEGAINKVRRRIDRAAVGDNGMWPIPGEIWKVKFKKEEGPNTAFEFVNLQPDKK